MKKIDTKETCNQKPCLCCSCNALLNYYNNNSYGGIANISIQEIILIANEDYKIRTNALFKYKNIDYTNNQIIIKVPGIYKVDYMINILPSNTGEIQYGVRKNEIDRTSLHQRSMLSALNGNQFSASAIMSLVKNDRLDMFILSETDKTISLGGDISAILIINKIS